MYEKPGLAMGREADRMLTRGKWMVALGVLACTIACAAPLLLGLLGVGTGVIAMARRAESLAAMVVIGGASLIGVAVWRRRAAADGPARSDSCGCAPAALPDEPIACTLDGKGMGDRLEEFRGAFRRGFAGKERIADGFRWRFRAAPGLEEHLRALAEREQSCCRFLQFDIFVASQGQEIWWETRARAEADPVMEEFFRLPEQLT